MKIKNLKFKIITIIAVALLGYSILTFFQAPSRELDLNSAKLISINDNGLIFETETSAETVEQLLQEKNILLGDYDLIIPAKEDPLFMGENIIISRAVKFEIQVDDQIIENYSTAKTIDGVLQENNIKLNSLDKISPALHLQPHQDENIIITRINIEEKTVTEDIAFATINKEDSKLGWREKKIEQQGVLGRVEISYKITYQNGKEVSRVPLKKNIIREPVTEIITQGTYMQLKKAVRGDASFYASSWGELNASRTIPRGGFAKVTNLDNGKSVIVKINDYGPQSPERIIDLSYASFAKIGSLGQGILHNVKVEQVLN